MFFEHKNHNIKIHQYLCIVDHTEPRHYINFHQIKYPAIARNRDIYDYESTTISTVYIRTAVYPRVPAHTVSCHMTLIDLHPVNQLTLLSKSVHQY